MAQEITDSNIAPYTLLISQLGGKPTRYIFAQPRVMVGRGLENDLRVEHIGFSRMQFLIERGVGSAGEARFRITPFEVTNPTYVNGRPAVEGTLTPGDVIAVADVRVMLEHRVKKDRKRTEKVKKVSGGIPPVRMALLGLLVVMGSLVGYLYFGEQEAEMVDVTTAPAKLFESPDVHCENAVECAARAHDSYAKARKYALQSGADPGNLYRSAVEYERAARFRELSGKPLSDISDVDARVQESKSRTEVEFNDARFALSRAIANHDNKRASQQAEYLAKLVPNEQHPYRIKLDAYRRTLTQGEK